jgi:hypothetical protein
LSRHIEQHRRVGQRAFGEDPLTPLLLNRVQAVPADAAVSDRAFGATGGRIRPAVAEPAQKADEGKSPALAAWAQARARGLGDVLEMLAGNGEHADAVGSKTVGSGIEIGQFFPLTGVKIAARCMKAIKALIKP